MIILCPHLPTVFIYQGSFTKSHLPNRPTAFTDQQKQPLHHTQATVDALPLLG